MLSWVRQHRRALVFGALSSNTLLTPSLQQKLVNQHCVVPGHFFSISSVSNRGNRGGLSSRHGHRRSFNLPPSHCFVSPEPAQPLACHLPQAIGTLVATFTLISVSLTLMMLVDGTDLLLATHSLTGCSPSLLCSVSRAHMLSRAVGWRNRAASIGDDHRKRRSVGSAAGR